MRAWKPALLAGALLLAGCGGTAVEDQSRGDQASAPSATSPTPTPTTVTIPPANAGLQLAVSICADGMVEPDAVMHDAVRAARENTRPYSQFVGSLQETRTLVETLAGQALKGGLSTIGQSLQDYAQALGRSSASEVLALSEVADTREAIDIACLTGAYESSAT